MTQNIPTVVRDERWHQVKQMLTDKFVQAKRELAELVRGIREKGEGVDDLEATWQVEDYRTTRAQQVRIKDVEVQSLNRALLLHNAGTYGICQACGEPIEEKRLKALVGATDCRDCREKAEAGTLPEVIEFRNPAQFDESPVE